MKVPGRLVVSLTAALVVLGAGCDDGDDGEGPSARNITVDGRTISETRLTDALDGLCEARAEAGGDVGAARDTFYDRSHDDLHLIASALDTVDSATAARLLEAKQRVEAGLDAEPAPPGLPADIDRLVTATQSALEKLSVTAPDCRDTP